MKPRHQYPRTARVNELLREVIAQEVEDLSAADLGLLTITGVDVSPDLHSANVFYSSIGGNAEATQAALNAAAPQIQERIASEVRIKYTPRLKFLVDPSIESAQRVEEIIRELHTGESQ